MREGEDDIGPAVLNGILRRVSVSQVTAFDPEQYGGCNRRWFLETVQGLKSADTIATRTGKEVHSQIEHYLRTGEDALGMIARQGKHFIPTPDPRYLIEHGFGTASTVKLLDEWRERVARVDVNGNDGADVDEAVTWQREVLNPGIVGALVAEDVPFIGYIDLVNPTGVWLNNEGEVKVDPLGTIELVDWKTSSSIVSYGKAAHELVNTVQMIGYAQWAHGQYPKAEWFRISHGYMQTKGHDAQKKSALIDLATVNTRWQTVVSSVREMRDVAKESDHLKVEPNHASCGAYRGCPHRALCPRSAENVFADMFGAGRNAMGLLDKLKKGAAAAPATTGGHSTPQGHVAPARDAETAAKAAIAAEVEKLKAEERGVCAVDGEILTPNNSSKLPSGQVVHVGCVTPPDAPKSGTVNSAALPVSAESMASLSPEVAKAAETFAKPAETAPATTARRKRIGSKPVEPKAETTHNPPAGPVFDAVADAALLKAFHEAQAEGQAQIDSGPNGSKETLGDDVQAGYGLNNLFLYVDVVFSGTIPMPVKALEMYIVTLCAEIADHFKVSDLRFAPSDSLIGFGKWKGALAAAVRAAPPPAGMYTLRGVRESEIKQVVLEALEPLCQVVVRGSL